MYHPFRFSLFLATGILILLASCRNEQTPADMIITNTTIWTGNPEMPFAEAMAVKGDTILAIGTSKEVAGYKDDHTKVLDLNGKFITPGFIDSHLHFLEGGFDVTSVHLRDAKTPEEFIDRIAAYAKSLAPGEWILGGKWDHENWGGTLPSREWIDSVTPDNPVFVSRLDGHMALANSLALKLAGVNNNTADVAGGSMVRDRHGRLTGILKDNAMSLMYDKIPEPTPAQVDTALAHAMRYVASKGVTSVVHMVGHLDALEKARDHHALITRLYVAWPLADWQGLVDKIKKEGRGDKWLRIGGLKGFVDGSLGSHTAAFFEPYADAPEKKGFFVNAPEDLYRWISDADKAGLQVMIHAIGDSAVHFLLDTYERVEKENGERDRRFRVEHAQHLIPSDIGRFAGLGVIPSMQPYHCIDDGRWAEKRIGPERIKTTHAYKSLFDSGARVAFGSDWPVAPPTPLEGIYAALTRRTLDGKNPGGWVPEQKISLEQALTAYTVNGAYASFQEDIKGSLEPGKLADFVVLEKNLFETDPVEIKDVKVLQTWVGGKKVFDIQDHK